MSTTDTRAVFESQAVNEGYRLEVGPNGKDYLSGHTQVAWEWWQAATEAAKAAGTALQPMTMSYVQNVPDQCDRITWRGAYYLLKEGAEAARQPASILSEAQKLRLLACIETGVALEIVTRSDADAILAATNRSQP